MKQIPIILCFIFGSIHLLISQNYPWNNPLKMATSTNGITFSNSSIFQDSSGVPCVIHWKGDTLIAAFQWFRLPNPSPSWDRVAVKFSYDNGITWTQPTPILISGLPSNFQRPFDPALAVFAADSLRIYFSSSNGMPTGGLDSNINTFSAKSKDGIHYIFENNPRVDETTNRVIDPSIIYFNNSWHYVAPIGSPQQGAYHYVSPDGINFSKVPDIPSDNFHNWTGNYMVENNNELRFYGSGANVWYNSSSTGGVWNGFVNTNIHGGDPSVVKISTNNYLMVYVGEPYKTGIRNISNQGSGIKIFPDPVHDIINFETNDNQTSSSFNIINLIGLTIQTGTIGINDTFISVENLDPGLYYLVFTDSCLLPVKFIKE